MGNLLIFITDMDIGHVDTTTRDYLLHRVQSDGLLGRNTRVDVILW
jgi:hypothetical protein